MTTILERVFGKLDAEKDQRRATGWQRCREILMQAASGDTDGIDPVELEMCRDELGWTREQMAEAAELMTKRIQWAVEYNADAGLRDRQREIENQLSQADAKLRAAKEKHASTVEPLKNEFMMNQSALMKAANARTSLARRIIDPEIKRRQQELQRRRMTLHQQSEPLRHQLNESNTDSAAHKLLMIEQEIHSAKKMKSAKVAPIDGRSVGDWEKTLADWKSYVADCEKKLHALDEQHAELDREQQQIEAEKLEP